MSGSGGNGNAVDYFLDRHEREGRGAATAFRDPSRSLSYGELANATRRFAGALRSAGVARERRIALLLLDTIDFPIAFWGAIRAGVVPVPINTLLIHDMVGYILADSRADAVAISAPLAAALLPVLQSLAELRRIIIVQPDGAAPVPLDDPRLVTFSDFLASGDPAARTCAIGEGPSPGPGLARVLLGRSPDSAALCRWADHRRILGAGKRLVELRYVGKRTVDAEDR